MIQAAKFTLPVVIGAIIAASATYFAMRGGLGVTEASGSNREPSKSTTLNNDVLLQDVTVFEVGRFSSPKVPVKYTAIISVRRRSQLAFPVSERINEVLVHEGDPVYAGQILARQEQAALAAQVATAEADVLQSKARLAEQLQGPREQTIRRARAIVEQRKSELGVARASLSRYEKLIAVDSTSEEEYDDARFRVESNRAALSAAEEELAELEAGTRPEQIDASRATAAAAEAELKRVKIRLEQTELKAPFNGHISSRMLDEGALPAPAQPVLEIVESDQMEVRFGVDPSIAKGINLEEKIRFECLGESYVGVVSRKQPVLDSATRTQDIILSVAPEDSRKLIDGCTAQIEFAKEQTTDGLWIPTRALVPQVRGLWSVYVTGNDAPAIGKVLTEKNVDEKNTNVAATQRRDVELLATWGSWSQVRGTLESGESVILDGANRISEGQFVRAQSMSVDPPWMLANQVRSQIAESKFSGNRPAAREASLPRKPLTEKNSGNED